MQKIAILGMGSSGISATRLALAKKFRVHCIDSRPNAPTFVGAQHHYGDAPFDLTKDFDALIVSPGVTSKHPLIQSALQQEIPVIGELGFATQWINIPILAITGTNGKSSTAWYTHQLLRKIGRKSFIGGNFGIAVSDLVVEMMDDSQKYDVAVLEVSSYQLEFANHFHPHAAVALNLTPDHLARHGTMSEYARCKRQIFAEMNTQNYAIFPQENTDLQPNTKACKWQLGLFPGAKILEDRIQIQTSKGSHEIVIADLQLLGRHNYENIAASALLLQSLDIDISRLPYAELSALEHRLEKVQADHRLWINDSKATNIEATIAALESLTDSAIVLLGGAGKEGADYTLLHNLLKKKAKAIICFGQSGVEIFESLSSLDKIYNTVDLSSAIKLSKNISAPQDTILLSPACASFDEFNNFEHRGTIFKQLIFKPKEAL